jgi:Fur family ferric uptake transcriptional regulator
MASASASVTQRKTRQRAAIKAAFESIDRPLSASEVLDSASSQVEGIGIATVYRAIRALLDEGWLSAVELPGEPPRYEVAGKAHHHHFRCNDCGRVFEVHSCLADMQRIAPAGFLVTGHDLILFGCCPDCARHHPTLSKDR